MIDRVDEHVGGAISWTVHDVGVDRRLHGAIGSFVTLVPGHRPSAEQIEASRSATRLSWISSSCDIRLDIGRRYVIYARRTAEGRWTTSTCSGAKLVERAAEDLDHIAGNRVQ